MSSLEIREDLVKTLHLDLIGPSNDSTLATEELLAEEQPSRRYLTGFLAPKPLGNAEPAGDDLEQDQADSEPIEDDQKATDDNTVRDVASAKKAYFPTTMGLSFFVQKGTGKVTVNLKWGEYSPTNPLPKDLSDPNYRPGNWKRKPQERTVELLLPDATSKPVSVKVKDSDGLELYFSVKPIHLKAELKGLMPDGTRSVALFLVNGRTPLEDRNFQDVRFIFQAQMEVQCEEGFTPRPDPRGYGSSDWDDRIADLQYRDVLDYAVGHGVSSKTLEINGVCKVIQTSWLPESDVEIVDPSKIDGVEFGMEALAAYQDAKKLGAVLRPMVAKYREWIKGQRDAYNDLPARRKEVAQELLNRANSVANRIEAGIATIETQDLAFKAFIYANKAMAQAGKQRQVILKGKVEDNPTWRPFQLAFLLMALRGIVDPTHDDRSSVDLLFFPTGGGKTEAYLGLAAFTMVYRRLKNPGIASAGLSVLMRYTLRLLTLDQLGRASTLICALELERQADPRTLGEWPFEIGLWVGSGATPNMMGAEGEDNPYTARTKTIQYQNNRSYNPPIPLSQCPWCGAPFGRNSYHLIPTPEKPKDLRINCSNVACKFTRSNYLPVIGVDEPIYRRLPCFLIATVDKFASMPWTGEVANFFGKVDRYDKDGFYGPTKPSQGNQLPGPLLPPDLVIQDELHLISGPMGSMVGLYETALDELCSRMVSGKKVRTKIIASTATVRKAQDQILALFNRKEVEIFPAPGPNRNKSFFSETVPLNQQGSRKYVGIAAQGRSGKFVLLKSYLAIMGAAQKAWVANGGDKNPNNPADPYMSLLGYFNNLRELGGSRRTVEDQIFVNLKRYGEKKRVGEVEGLFANREINAFGMVELTSRVSTGDVAEAKRKLTQPFNNQDHVDVALATNMISVGLDITRLGLMVVFGQPKTTSEYIQATSRVGRQFSKPGLIATVFNINRVRDRSHYERFSHFHRTFYRQVEAFSVTPFSPRALDRGLAGALVGLARLGIPELAQAGDAGKLDSVRAKVDALAEAFVERISNILQREDVEEVKQSTRRKIQDLLDAWSKIAANCQKDGVALKYQVYELKDKGKKYQPLLYDFLSEDLKANPQHKEFRTGRSLRDVEQNVNLFVLKMDKSDLDS